MKKMIMSVSEIDLACQRIANEIEEVIKDDERLPLFLGIMDGALQFYTKMTSYIKRPLLQEFMKVKSYEGTNTTGHIVLLKDININIDNRTIIIVEDVVDTGYTMKYLVDYLKAKGNPKRICICALFDKTYARKIDVKIDFVGKSLDENEFLLGFGLDYNGLCRNIPYVYSPAKEDVQQMDEIIAKDN